MVIEWETLTTIEDWANALDKILKAAKSAIEANDFDKKLEIQKLLNQYIKESPGIDSLNAFDEIAGKASRDIFLGIVDKALESIASRNAELKKLMALVNGVTEQVKTDKKQIVFEKLTDALNKTKVSIDILKKLEEELENPDQNLLDKIEAVNRTVVELKSAIE